MRENNKTDPVLDNDHPDSNTQCPALPMQFPLAANSGCSTGKSGVALYLGSQRHVSHVDKQGFLNPLNTRNGSFRTTTAATPMTEWTSQSWGIHPRPGEPGDELMSIFGHRQRWAWPRSTHFFSSASQGVHVIS